MKKECEKCNKEYEADRARRKFCSKSCSVASNNIGRRRHGKEPGDCIECGERLKSHCSKFCDHSCQGVYQKREVIRKWKSGEVSGSDVNGKIRASIRRYLLEEADHVCPLCDWGEINPLVSHGKPILTIDHIDGDYENNSPENLRVLCYNCHTLTPTFGRLNNSGKSYKRFKRQIEGKIAED